MYIISVKSQFLCDLRLESYKIKQYTNLIIIQNYKAN